MTSARQSREGPDVSDPLEWFNDGDYWYRLYAVPLTLYVSEWDTRFGWSISGALVQGFEWWRARRQDQRYKSVIMRVPRKRKHGSPEPTLFFEFAVHASKADALNRCRRIVGSWSSGAHATNGLTYDELKTAIEAIRRTPGINGA